ncbi:MAG: prepilin peptidase [Patescibacteria group bacterium]
MTLLLFFILGGIIGSFLNVVILRTHNGTQSWLKGRSHCPSCHHRLGWYDLVPIISYVLLNGRCRYCNTPISVQYPLVEAVTALLFGLVYIVTVGTALETSTTHTVILLARNLLVVCVLVILFVYDFRWQLIPDRITLPAIIFFFILNSLLYGSAAVCNPITAICHTIPGWTDYALGAILGGGFFLLQFVISKGKWIGGGDIRLGALIGVILGLSGTAIALFIAYMVGAIWGIGMIVSGQKKMGSAIPFGTFLSIATLIVLLWYPQVIALMQRYLIL